MTSSGDSLRILFHHRVAASDGMRVHIAEVAAALRARGHEVRIVGPVGEAGERQAGASTRLEHLADTLRRRLPPALFEALELLYNLPAYRRLKAEAEAFRPDVLYERYNLFLLAGLRLKRRLKIPMLLEINSPLARERAEFGDLALKALGRRCEAALWRGADAVLPVTGVLAQEVRQVRPRGLLEVAHNGAHPDRRPSPGAVAEARLGLGLDKDALVLGFVGFVRAWHGVGWAVEALAQLPERVHLVVVGDGPGGPELQARARTLKVAHRLHLTGRVPHEAVAAYMQTFDVALQTAAVSYASPLKLFEYMALGRAIVAPDQPNIREVLTHEHDALLFAPGRQAAFTEALRRLCQDAGLRERLGAAAARTVCEAPFTWARNAERIETLARRLTGGDVPAAGPGVVSRRAGARR